MPKPYVYRDRKGALRRKIVEDVMGSLDDIFADATQKAIPRIDVISKGRGRTFERSSTTGKFEESLSISASQSRDEKSVLYGLQTPVDKFKNFRKPKRGPGMGH